MRVRIKGGKERQVLEGSLQEAEQESEPCFTGASDQFRLENKNVEAASQLIKEKGGVSLSSVHKKAVSTENLKHICKYFSGSSCINAIMGGIPGFTFLSLCNSYLCQLPKSVTCLQGRNFSVLLYVVYCLKSSLFLCTLK